MGGAHQDQGVRPKPQRESPPKRYDGGCVTPSRYENAGLVQTLYLTNDLDQRAIPRTLHQHTSAYNACKSRRGVHARADTMKTGTPTPYLSNVVVVVVVCCERCRRCGLALHHRGRPDSRHHTIVRSSGRNPGGWRSLCPLRICGRCTSSSSSHSCSSSHQAV